MFRGGRDWKRSKTRVPAITTPLQHIYRRTNTRGNERNRRRNKSRRKTFIQALRFADDQAMLATTQEGLQRLMNQLNLISIKYNMKINIGKTKTMRIGRGEEEIEVKITINGEEVEQVKSFCYLGR